MATLFTFGLKCFNQRPFIGAAVQAALAQSYRPLEIVISDDASTDGSLLVIREVLCAAGFVLTPDTERVWRGEKNGVSVVVNENVHNLGNLGNWLRICSLAHGSWIVKADGDDVSEPERVAAIAAAVEAREKVTVVTCGGSKISQDGRVIGHFRARSARYPLGACMAFRRDCFTHFPLPANGHIVDDEVFARRALMLGEQLQIDRPLVRYRIGGGISSNCSNIRLSELRCMQLFPESMRQCRQDLESIREKLGETAYRKWQERFEEETVQCIAHMTLREATSFGARWRAYRQVEKSSWVVPYHWKLIIYLFPRWLGDVMLRFATKLRYGRW